MSWEEGCRRRYPCPCGGGEFEEIDYSDDWGRSRTEHEMLCPKCKELYSYSEANIRPNCKPHHEIDSGWVLKSVLQAERKEQEAKNKVRQQIMDRVKELYYDKWVERFSALKTKKSIQEVFARDTTYETFCRHTKGYSREQLFKYVNGSYRYSNIRIILEICDVDNPDWDLIGANEEFVKAIMGKSS